MFAAEFSKHAVDFLDAEFVNSIFIQVVPHGLEEKCP
jgi:hypothetical protein